MTKLLLILFLSLSFQAFAGVIKDTARHFEIIGTPVSFQWVPERYETIFKYDVLYYIPEKIKDSENVKTLLFMHGGGASTMTRAGSLNVAQSYLKSTLIPLADELGIAVIVPSASGLNWGGHTVGMIRDLNNLIRTELNVDTNNMGLSGHSMGGMGIGRSFPLLADEFAYFLPMASGIVPASQTESHLNKVFNTPYVHLQGLKDHFPAFIENSKLQEKNTKLLEEKYGEKSKLEVIFYNGSHNHDYKLMKNTLIRLQASPRNIYQRKLYGSLYYNDNFYIENEIRFHQGSSSRYFWVEIAEASGNVRERLDFKASISDNVIKIDFDQKAKVIKKLRVNLTKKLLDPEKEIELIVNGVSIEKRMLEEQPHVNIVDRAYQFDDYMEFSL